MKVISEISVVSTLQEYQMFKRADPYSVHPRKVRSIEKIEEVAEEKGYDILPLIDLLEIPPSSGRGGLPVISNGEVKIVKPANLTDLFLVDLTDCERTTLDAYNSSEKGRLQNLDILVLSAAHAEGYIGTNTSIVHLNDDKKAICIGELIRLRPNIDRINPYYLTLYLNSIISKYMLNYSVRGQTVHLYPKDIELLPVLLPPREIQDSIGNKLKQAIEAKIEAEKKRKEIEEIIYRNLLNIPIYPREISSKYNIKEIKSTKRCDPHFHNPKFVKIFEFIKSKSSYKIRDFFKLLKGVTPSGNYYDEGIPFIRIQDLTPFGIDIEHVAKIRKEEAPANATIVRQYDILLAITGATIGKISIYLEEKGAFCTSDILILRPKDKLSHEEIFGFLALFSTQHYNLVFKKGVTGVTNQHLSAEYVSQIPILFNRLIKEIGEKYKDIILNSKRSKQLHSQAMEELNKLLGLNSRGDKS
ncbi:hypothetical protein JCM9492_05610 [Aquifex pyrophilus]